MPDKDTRRALRIIGIIAFGLLAYYGLSEMSKSFTDAVTPSSDAPAVQQDVPVSDISWQTVDAIYSLSSKETDLGKDEKWKAFAGRRVRWTGAVAEVSKSLGSLTLQVKMNPETFSSDLIVYLDDNQYTRALTLKNGDPVTFTGILDRWGTLLPIALKNGQIEN